MAQLVIQAAHLQTSRSAQTNIQSHHPAVIRSLHLGDKTISCCTKDKAPEFNPETLKQPTAFLNATHHPPFPPQLDL